MWTEEQKLRRKIESSRFNRIGDTAIVLSGTVFDGN